MKTIRDLKLSQEPKLGGERFSGLYDGLMIKVWQFCWTDPALRKVVPSKPLKQHYNCLVVQMGGPGRTTTQNVCDIPKAMYFDQDMDAYLKELFKHLLHERKEVLRHGGMVK